MRALPFVLLVACGASALAQSQTEPAPSPAAASPAPVVPLAGEWAGSARYSSEGAPACRYTGPAEPAAVKLQISVSGDTGSGRLVLELPAAAGPSCPAIRERTSVKEMKLSPSTVAFRDAQGREWNLAVKEGVLQGIFAGPSGSGEVALRKTATVLGGAGLGSGAIGIVGANVVGLGALAGINKLAQDDSSGTTTITCSPRACLVEIPGQSCDCGQTLVNVLSGGGCGTTGSGLTFGEACSLPERPCQAELSCDNSACLQPASLGGPCPTTP